MTRSDAFPTRLKRILEEGLHVGGIKAEVEIEKVKGTKLYRVYVIAPQFENLNASERQDLVWRILGQHLRSEEQLQISMIYPVTSDDLVGR